MKTIPLTQNQFAMVDDSDYEHLAAHKWYALRHGRTYYARAKIDGKVVEMHHFIVGKPMNGFVTDHIDGNGINNQRENLRHITARKNCQNRNHPKTSIFCGVNWRKDAKKWRAQIEVNSKKIHLGLFRKEEEAAKAYADACNKFS